MMRPKKHLSSVANHLLQQCSMTLGTTVDDLVAEFEKDFLKNAAENYSRRLVEFCSLKALVVVSHDFGDKILDGSFNRFTYDMMLAWEKPNAAYEEPNKESIAKEKEDKKEALGTSELLMDDETPLFYSDIMPLLVTEEPSVGEDAYVWFGSLFPLASDVVNARFTFEALTAATANKFHYPAYDRFLKEMDKCVKFLQKLPAPTGTELAEDEFILHVEGTARTQRVVRHIGTSSWPGRLTLTNKALYFEASGVVSYEPALKIDLSEAEMGHLVKAASTGPFGAPLFDKAITYESSSLSEPLILEFPEMTGSTRRDLWLTLIKEVIILHRFISLYKIESPIHAWELHSKTILGVIRLHAAREMLRMSPPAPANFLVFSLYDDLPKGDYVLEKLANSLKQTSTITTFSASYIFRSLTMARPMVLSAEMKQGHEEDSSSHMESLASLETTIGQVRDEAKEVTIAKASIKGMEDEGITDSLLVLVNLVRPLGELLPAIQRILSWERPPVTAGVLAVTLLIIYREWAGNALAASLIVGVGVMRWARQRRIGEICSEVIIDTSSDKTTVESIVDAQHSLKRLHEAAKTANVAILRLWSLVLSRSPKHTELVIWAMTGAAMVLAVIPFKYVLVGLTLWCFLANTRVAKAASGPGGGRRWKEWWESVPAIPVRTVDTSSTKRGL